MSKRRRLNHSGRSGGTAPLPYDVIAYACAADDAALALVLEHFDAYISELAMRAVKGRHGTTSYVLDVDFKAALQEKLITAILKWKELI